MPMNGPRGFPRLPVADERKSQNASPSASSSAATARRGESDENVRSAAGDGPDAAGVSAGRGQRSQIALAGGVGVDGDGAEELAVRHHVVEPFERRRLGEHDPLHDPRRQLAVQAADGDRAVAHDGRRDPEWLSGARQGYRGNARVRHARPR